MMTNSGQLGEFENAIGDVHYLKRKRATGIRKYRCGGYNPTGEAGGGGIRGFFEPGKKNDLVIVGKRETGENNQLADNLVHVFYGPFPENPTGQTGLEDEPPREGCCPNECPCYPMNDLESQPSLDIGGTGSSFIINRRFIDPPMHLRRKISGQATNAAHKKPKIEMKIKPEVEGLAYEHGVSTGGGSSDSGGQRALRMGGLDYFECSDADIECKDASHGDCGSVGSGPQDDAGQHKQCDPTNCCRNPICDDTMFNGGIAGDLHDPIPDNVNTSSTTDPEMAGLLTHSRCWQPWKHLRVWFWVMPYWDAPRGKYSDPENDDYSGSVTYEGGDSGSSGTCGLGGMYVTADPTGGISWAEGILTNGFVKISPGAENTFDTPDTQPGGQFMRGLEWGGNWGWYYSSPHAVTAGPSSHNNKIIFKYGGGTSINTPDPAVIPCIGPRRWQFHHADMYYMQEGYPGSAGSEPPFEQVRGQPPFPRRTAEVKLTLHVGHFGADNKTPTLHKIVDGFIFDAGHSPNHPNNAGLLDGKLYLGNNPVPDWSPMPENTGVLGFGGYKLVEKGWIATTSYSKMAETYDGTHNPDGAGPNTTDMHYGGWLIDEVGFDKGSSQGPEGSDTNPEYTAESLWNGGKGVPCIGSPDLGAPQFPIPLEPPGIDPNPTPDPPFPEPEDDDDAEEDGEGFEDLDELEDAGWEKQAICIKDNDSEPTKLAINFQYSHSAQGLGIPSALSAAGSEWARRIGKPGFRLEKDGEVKYRIKPDIHCTVTTFRQEGATLATCSIASKDRHFKLPSAIKVRVNIGRWNSFGSNIKYKILLHELGHGVGISSQMWGRGKKLISGAPLTALAYSNSTGLVRSQIPLAYHGPTWATPGFKNHGHFLAQCACIGGQVYYGTWSGNRFGYPHNAQRSELMTPIISQKPMIITHTDMTWLVEVGWCCMTSNSVKTHTARTIKAMDCCNLTGGNCNPDTWRVNCVDCSGNQPQPTETEIYEMSKEIEKGIVGYCGGDTGDVIYHE